jgi:hypothetical protein
MLLIICYLKVSVECSACFCINSAIHFEPCCRKQVVPYVSNIM